MAALLSKKSLVFAILLPTFTGCVPESVERFIIETKPDPPGPPYVVNSTDESITIRYTSATDEPQHALVESMIVEHCGGPYKGERILLNGSFTVEAECL
jgi:hypothetical protein